MGGKTSILTRIQRRPISGHMELALTREFTSTLITLPRLWVLNVGSRQKKKRCLTAESAAPYQVVLDWTWKHNWLKKCAQQNEVRPNPTRMKMLSTRQHVAKYCRLGMGGKNPKPTVCSLGASIGKALSMYLPTASLKRVMCIWSSDALRLRWRSWSLEYSEPKLYRALNVVSWR